MKSSVVSLATCILLSAKIGFGQAVCQIPHNPSADFGEEVAACAKSLPVSGGTIDASAIAGPIPQSCETSFRLPPYTVLKIAAGTTIGAQGPNLFGICRVTMERYSTIEGGGAGSALTRTIPAEPSSGITMALPVT